MSWSPPASNGNRPITGYTVTTTPGGATATAGGSATTAILSGLTDETSYTFTVHATNVAGGGPESGTSNLVTPSAAAPMSFSGSKIGAKLCTCNTLTVSIGGVACTASIPLNYSASFTLQAGCGTAGQAVTFAINGAPAGFIIATDASCLACAPGTSVSGLQVETGYAQDTSCATAGLPAGGSGPILAGVNHSGRGGWIEGVVKALPKMGQMEEV